MDNRNRFDIRFQLKKKGYKINSCFEHRRFDVVWIRTLFTSSSGVSNVTWWTSAISAVVVHRTLSWLDAWIISGTRIDTFGVNACLVAGTIRVRPTAGDHTGYLWISGHSGRTFAHGLMVDTVTFGRCATTATVRGTNSHTNTIDAGVLTRTVGFASTTGWKYRKVIFTCSQGKFTTG